MRTVLLLTLLTACAPRSAGPDVTWKRFVEATRKGDATTAWSLVSSETRVKLTEQARKAALVQRLPEPSDGSRFMLTPLASRQPALDLVEAVFFDADTAEVRVRDKAGGRGSVLAVREEGVWRFNLVDAIASGD